MAREGSQWLLLMLGSYKQPLNIDWLPVQSTNEALVVGCCRCLPLTSNGFHHVSLLPTNHYPQGLSMVHFLWDVMGDAVVEMLIDMPLTVQGG